MQQGVIKIERLIDEKVHNCYWQHDLCCAITTLKILSERFRIEIGEDVFSATLGLNAGRDRLQCGLVQGALMFIGICGARRSLIENDINNICREYIKAFKSHFGSLECRFLRSQGFRENNPPHLCEQLTKEAVVFAAEFIGSKNIMDN